MIPNPPKSICGVNETGWLNCVHPLRMPKVLRGRLSPRKCALVACAYVLHSPGRFTTDFARRVAETIQRRAVGAPPRSKMGEEIRDALWKTFPKQLDERIPHGLQLRPTPAPGAPVET